VTTPSFETPKPYRLRVQSLTQYQVLNVWGLKVVAIGPGQWEVVGQVVYPDIRTDAGVLNWSPIIVFQCEKTAHQFLRRYGGDLGTGGNATIYHEEWREIDEKNLADAQKELLEETTQELLDNRRQSQVTRHLDMTEGAEDSPEPVPEEIPEEVQFVLDGLTQGDEQTRREASLVVSAALLAAQNILSSEELTELAHTALTGAAATPASDYWGQFEREGDGLEPVSQDWVAEELQAAQEQRAQEREARAAAMDAFDDMVDREAARPVASLRSPSHADAPMYGECNNPPPNWENEDFIEWRADALMQVLEFAYRQQADEVTEDQMGMLNTCLELFVTHTYYADGECFLSYFQSYVEARASAEGVRAFHTLRPALEQLWPGGGDPRIEGTDPTSGAWYLWLQRFLAPGVVVAAELLQVDNAGRVCNRLLNAMLDEMLSQSDEDGLAFHELALSQNLHDAVNSRVVSGVSAFRRFISTYFSIAGVGDTAANYGIDGDWRRDTPIYPRQFHNVLLPFVRAFVVWQAEQDYPEGPRDSYVTPYVDHLCQHSNYGAASPFGNSPEPLLTPENKEEWYRDFEVATREIVYIPEPHVTTGRVRYIQAYRRMVRSILDMLFTPDS